MFRNQPPKILLKPSDQVGVPCQKNLHATGSHPKPLSPPTANLQIIPDQRLQPQAPTPLATTAGASRGPRSPKAKAQQSSWAHCDRGAFCRTESVLSLFLSWRILQVGCWALRLSKSDREPKPHTRTMQETPRVGL